MAAQSIASCAARLGVSTVRTAITEAEALARLAEAPAELILADTAVTRVDVVGFTQRILAASPRSVLVLFGTEEPRMAAAAVAAGARGLIRAGDQEPVATVTKAILLIGAGARAASPTSRPAPTPAPGRVLGGAGRATPVPPGQVGPWPIGVAGRPGKQPPPTVPAQRGDLPPPANALTERELQVLRGMAEGKSNAEIGRELYVSEDTVKTHARRLFRKLGARDRAHAVAVGFRSGMLG